MSFKQFPIVVHRWFPHGPGWAYHPSVNLLEVVNCLDSVLHHGNREGERGMLCLQGTDGWVIYVMRPDTTTKDVQVVGRSPFYLSAVVLPKGKEPTNAQMEEFCGELNGLPEVDKSGQNYTCKITRVKNSSSFLYSRPFVS